MFVGFLPGPVIEQIVRVVPFEEWRQVFVGGSSTFRVDRAVKQRHPSVLVHSNDVSLPACAIGALAMGETFQIHFVGRLAFMQQALHGQSFAARVAAVHVAGEMANYKRDNDFSRAHLAHYQERFKEFLAGAQRALAKFMDTLDIASFTAGDFRLQVARAAEVGGGVVAFPLTKKRRFDDLHRFFEENTVWPRPSYAP